MARMSGPIWLAVLLLTGLVPSLVNSLDNGLSRVPPMGWNSWSLFRCDIDEDLIHRIADRVVDLGLAELGYVYVNLDDCWMAAERGLNGTYQGEPSRFPSGMKALGDYLHSKGLLYGIYTSAGTLTCEGFPGSLASEQLDAQTFASWGVDYLKYDNCYNEDIPSVDRYPVMRDALLSTGRSIFYSLCQWGEEDSWRWAPSVGNAWRTTKDMTHTWQSIVFNFWESYKSVPFSGRGKAFADPDLMEIGVAKLTIQEQQSHFALWVLVKAPLLLSMDLDTISEDTLSVISNRELITLHQDERVAPGLCFLGCDPLVLSVSVFATTANNGDTVALVINWGDSDVDGFVFAGQDVGVVPSNSEQITVTDLWTSNEVGTFSFDDLKRVTLSPLAPHECAVYRFTTSAVSRALEFA